MEQLTPSSRVDNALRREAPAGSPRCPGVPPSSDARRIDCEVLIAPERIIDALGVKITPPCETCSAEIERRVDATAARTTHDAEARLRSAAGLSAPFVAGAKSIKTIRPLTSQHREALMAVQELARWTPADGCRLSIRLVGDPGLGKSDLAEAYIAEVAGRGRGLYANVRTILLKLQGSFRDDSPESTDTLIERYATVPHLALDDLGASKPTRFTADALYELFERRTRNQLPTVVVSNYVSLSDLAQRLAPSDGDALDSIRPVDRIDELCPRVIVLRGSSLRATISREAAVA